MSQVQLVLSYILFLSSLGEANIYAKYETFDFPAFLQENLSCLGQCNKESTVCSCKAKCRLYGSCCEDFQEMCPQEYSSPRVQHLLGSQVVCPYNHKTFMVASCPNRNRRRETEYPMRYFPALRNVPGNESTEDGWTRHRAESITTIFDQRPVIDLYNKVLFANMSVYSCNAVPQSEPLFWDVILSIDTALEDIKNLESVLFFRQFEIKYIPPLSLLNSGDILIRCEEAYVCPLEESDYNSHMCSRFMTYVEIRGKIYNNIYCGRCEILKDFPSLPIKVLLNVPAEIRESRAEFPSLFNLPQNKFIEVRSGTNTATTWKSASCSSNQATASASEVNHCRITECKDGAFQVSPYECKYPRKMRLAINLRMEVWTQKLLDRLPSFYSCVLSTYSKTPNLRADQWNTLPPFRFYSQTFNLFMFHFEIIVFWNDSFTHMRLKDDLKDLIRNATLAFERFHLLKNGQSTGVFNYRSIDDVLGNGETFDFAIQRLTSTKICPEGSRMPALVNAENLLRPRHEFTICHCLQSTAFSLDNAGCHLCCERVAQVAENHQVMSPCLNSSGFMARQFQTSLFSPSLIITLGIYFLD